MCEICLLMLKISRGHEVTRVTSMLSYLMKLMPSASLEDLPVMVQVYMIAL